MCALRRNVAGARKQVTSAVDGEDWLRLEIGYGGSARGAEFTQIGAVKVITTAPQANARYARFI